MDNGLEMNGWRDDGVLEGLTIKRETARRWKTRQWSARHWSSRSAMKQMARNGQLRDDAMGGATMECSKASVFELALGAKADGSRWTAKRRHDGRLALGNEVEACDGRLGDGAMMECSKAWR